MKKLPIKKNSVKSKKQETTKDIVKRVAPLTEKDFNSMVIEWKKKLETAALIKGRLILAERELDLARSKALDYIIGKTDGVGKDYLRLMAKLNLYKV